MMYKIIPSNKFKKDLRLAIKRGCNIDLMDTVVTTLSNGESLEEKYRDHPLKGDYTGCRECHITPDWLLIYEITDSDLILYLTRTGTHSDLF